VGAGGNLIGLVAASVYVGFGATSIIGSSYRMAGVGFTVRFIGNWSSSGDLSDCWTADSLESLNACT